MEEMLGSWALALTILMSLAIIAWFCYSIAQSFLKVMQRHKRLRYKALIRENQRLKRSLADSAKEHHLRKVHRTEAMRRESNQRIRRNVA
jgi:uncharacterized iron-regulated membrane protein